MFTAFTALPIAVDVKFSTSRRRKIMLIYKQNCVFLLLSGNPAPS